jgi:hypothetical protein
VSTPDKDAELEIALAEYSHINELRNQLDQKSSNRFNFYLALVTAVAAAVSGVLSAKPDNAATAGLGAIVLLFGVSIFARQVAFTSYSVRLAAAGNAIRLYLAQRAPDLKPYLLLPVGLDRGAFSKRVPVLIGFAATIGILNSAILGLLGSLFFGSNLGSGLLVVSLAGHFAYGERSRRDSNRAVVQIYQERGLS